MRVANNRQDFEHLAGFLQGLKSSVLIGFEATGNYHRPLAYFLHEHGFELRLIPTLALARTREAMHKLLGQERSQRRPGDPASAEDRIGSDLARPHGQRRQRCPGTFKDAFFR